MEEYILETRGLTKKFRKVKAVDEVNFRIKRGAIYGLIGRNGAGKTTFLKMVAGLSNPTSGEIISFGKQGDEARKMRDRIGCLIENPGLYDKYTAYQNLKIKCIQKGIKDPEYIQGILEIIGLADTGKKKAGKFSLGMKQRLGIGLALVGDPEILILDEPINGLDPQGIVEVRDLLLRLQKERNITILISSHILEELSKIATDYGIIHGGHLLEEMTHTELLDRCSKRLSLHVAETEKAAAVLEQMGIQEYHKVDAEHIDVMERLEESSEINKTLVQAGVTVQELTIVGEELEAYYLRMTGGR